MLEWIVSDFNGNRTGWKPVVRGPGAISLHEAVSWESCSHAASKQSAYFVRGSFPAANLPA
jgi:hypothetical protein